MSRPAKKQETPSDLIDELLGVIRRQFCAEMSKEDWWKSKRFLRRVITWPASHMTSKGFAVPPKRYREILLDVFNTIKVHGDTGGVKYWPGYLLHCVQKHFRHHGEEYRDEANQIAAKADLALTGIASASRAVDSGDVAALSAAHQVLKSRPSKKSPRAADSSQLDLFA